MVGVGIPALRIQDREVIQDPIPTQDRGSRSDSGSNPDSQDLGSRSEPGSNPDSQESCPERTTVQNPGSRDQVSQETRKEKETVVLSKLWLSSKEVGEPW